MQYQTIYHTPEEIEDAKNILAELTVDMIDPDNTENYTLAEKLEAVEVISSHLQNIINCTLVVCVGHHRDVLNEIFEEAKFSYGNTVIKPKQKTIA